MDLRRIEQMISARTQEGPQLDFKAGAALSNTGKHPTEFVKDVSGMANGAGGELIYGVAEAKTGGITVADKLDPVRGQMIDSEWMTQILRSRSSPPLDGY